MLTWLAELSPYFSPLNIFRYITFRTGGATATAMLFVFWLGPSIISLLRLKQGKGQPIREDGPKSHLLTKRGTPTMGGLMIMAGVLVSTLLWANLTNRYVWVVLLVTVGFGAIGFYDDYLKVTKQSHKGFSGRSRLAIEAVIAGIACIAIAMISTPGLSNKLALPFSKELLFDIGWFFVAFGGFVIVGAGNAVNITDGLDGLAIVPVMIMRPPMVGVPRFVSRCDCGPSSRIGWPLPWRKRRLSMIQGPHMNTNSAAVNIDAPVRKVM